MKIYITHPTSNANVRALVRAFDKDAILAEFATAVSTDTSSNWLKLLPVNIKNEMLRRASPVTGDKVWTHPFPELFRLVFPKIGLKYFTRHEQGFASLDAVFRHFDKAAANHLSVLFAKQKVDVVYAYEDGALSTFTAAKKIGVHCAYDLPIAYWETGKKLIAEEAERRPTWVETLAVGGGMNDSAEKLARKVRELELADTIICPGKFVFDSLPAWAKNKKIIISPFGSPAIWPGENTYERLKNAKRPLRVLFAGSMTQRKGLGDLFAAIRLLNNQAIELVVMGALLAPLSFYQKDLPGFTYEPGRPHNQVLELMRSCDVFCLPSIVEGRALVMQEAMSQGLPLIITPNTGGEDLVVEGKTGFLVPIRSPEAIAEKINWFLENRALIPEMSQNAKKHAAKYTWESYARGVIEPLNNLFNNN